MIKREPGAKDYHFCKKSFFLEEKFEKKVFLKHFFDAFQSNFILKKKTLKRFLLSILGRHKFWPYDILVNDGWKDLVGNMKSHFCSTRFSRLDLFNGIIFYPNIFFLLKRVLDRGPEHRESKMTVLCLLIILILIS